MSETAFPAAIKIYYGKRWFLLLTPSYLMDRAANPYRRLSATLLLACRQPFRLEAGDQPAIEARAALIAPNVLRRRTVALNSELALFDFPVGSPAYAALEPVVRGGAVLPLAFERFAALEPVLRRAATGVLSCQEIDALFSAVVEALCGHPPAARAAEPRIEKALALIDELRFDQVTLALLSERVHLSPSRLRHLFKEQTGCNLTQYARWVAVWRAANLWKQGKALTDIAQEVGFYDLAHLDRGFNEVFGWNPSTMIDPAFITLIRCL